VDASVVEWRVRSLLVCAGACGFLADGVKPVFIVVDDGGAFTRTVIYQRDKYTESQDSAARTLESIITSSK